MVKTQMSRFVEISKSRFSLSFFLPRPQCELLQAVERLFRPLARQRLPLHAQVQGGRGEGDDHLAGAPLPRLPPSSAAFISLSSQDLTCDQGER